MAINLGKLVSNVGTALKLPEFNISERLGYSPTPAPAPAPYQSRQVQSTPGQYNVAAQSYNRPAPQVLGTQTRDVGVPSTGSSGAAPSSFSTAQNSVNNQVDQGLDFIEQDYNNVLGQLAGEEQGLRGQADVAGQQIESEAGQVKTQLGQEQGVKEQGIQSQLNTAETESKSAMQQARDLFRQTQQSNIAQLSALGISSSSVAEALAERLGVETARRIAGVTGSLQEVRQNASKELARTKDYYQQRITDITNQVAVQKAQIQNSLLAGLNQINSARNQAATDKSRSRAELIQNAQSAINSLAQQQQQFEQSLKKWATSKAQSLTPIVTDPGYIQSILSAGDIRNQGFNPTQFIQGVQGFYNGDFTGQTQQSRSSKKKTTEEDILAAP